MDALLKELQKKLLSLPKKLSFKIGEASRLLGEKPYVLRYWEEEFLFLKPRKFQGGLRLYFKEDMETLFIIQALLRKKKHSIEGARLAFPALRKELALFQPNPLAKDKALSERRLRMKRQAQRLLEKISLARAALYRKDSSAGAAQRQ